MSFIQGFQPYSWIVCCILLGVFVTTLTETNEITGDEDNRPCSPDSDLSTLTPPICASCNSRCGRVVDLINQTSCSCDDHCMLYNDCCYDFSSICTQEYRIAKRTKYPKSDLPKCTKIELNKGYNWEHKYLMVRSCRRYTSPCSRSKSSPYDYIPVVDPTTGIHFINVKCAWCNGARNIFPWKVIATCKRMKLKVGENNVVYMKKLDKFELLKEAIRKPVKDAQCRIEFEPPINVRKPRKCLSDLARKCSETCQNEDLKNRCENGPLNYFSSGSVQYRNHECLLCTNKWPVLYGCGAQGRLPDDPWITRYSLPLLFDFDPRDGLKLGSKAADPPACYNGYFWIEYRCRKIAKSPDIASGENRTCQYVHFDYSEYKLMTNGTLTILSSGKSYHSYDWKMVNNSMFVCVEQRMVPTRKSIGLGWTTLILLALSCTALSFRVLLHVLLPELQNLAGRMQTSLAAAMLAAKIIILCGPSQLRGSVGCHLVGAFQHWALLAMFAWMSAVSVDIFRMLWMSTKLTRMESKKHTFFLYSVFAWGAPLIFLIVGEILNYTSRYEHLQPQYGMNYCWFNQRYALMILFVLPVVVSLIINIIAFTFSIILLIRFKKSNVKSQSNDYNIVLYFHLFILMGISWVLGIIAEISRHEVVDYIYTVLNASQGLLLTLGTACIGHIGRALRKKIKKLRKPSRDDFTSLFSSSKDTQESTT